jgi:hypothetical protein
MKSKFQNRIWVVLLLIIVAATRVVAQPVWQNSHVYNDPFVYYLEESLVNIGRSAYIGYVSTDSNDLGTCHFYVLDSIGTNIKDTSFTSAISSGEGFRKTLHLNNNTVVMITITDPDNDWREALTCFDANGNYLWRVYNDSNSTYIDACVSNDSIFVLCKNPDYTLQIYTSNGVLSSSISLQFTTTLFKELNGVAYNSGVIYFYGYEFYGGIDGAFYIKGISLIGANIFEAIDNPNNTGERVKDIVIDDSSNVYFIGTSYDGGSTSFSVGKFNSMGTLIWYDQNSYGINFATYENGLLLKNNDLFVTCTFFDSTTISGRFDKYHISNGILNNLYVFDSLAYLGSIKMRDFSKTSILLGSSSGSYTTPYCRFVEYNVLSNSVDTLYNDSALVNNFNLMVPKDSTGFFYGRDNIITYFEKTITSILENELSDDAQLPYPNPFYDKLNLECKETDIINFYDYSGRLCLSSVKSELEKKLPQLAKGNYIVEIINGAVSKKFRLVKN